MALVIEKFPVIIDLFGIREGKNDKTYFPPVGVAFLGEKANKDTGEMEPRLTVQLNLIPDVKIYGSQRKEWKKRESNDPGF